MNSFIIYHNFANGSREPALIINTNGSIDYAIELASEKIQLSLGQHLSAEYEKYGINHEDYNLLIDKGDNCHIYDDSPIDKKEMEEYEYDEENLEAKLERMENQEVYDAWWNRNY